MNNLDIGHLLKVTLLISQTDGRDGNVRGLFNIMNFYRTGTGSKCSFTNIRMHRHIRMPLYC